MHRVTFIPGDGIGPEVTGAARRCIEATGVQIEWDLQEAGEAVLEEEGTPLPWSGVLAAIGLWIMAVAVVVTVLTGGDYVIRALRVRRKAVRR
jgi:isocitrate dehydrogenase (NAD+)